jgi:hypothetical protein
VGTDRSGDFGGGSLWHSSEYLDGDSGSSESDGVDRECGSLEVTSEVAERGTSSDDEVDSETSHLHALVASQDIYAITKGALDRYLLYKHLELLTVETSEACSS